jgi:ubiquitin fusion degradation protein 1
MWYYMIIKYQSMSYNTQLLCFSFACSAQSADLTKRVKYSNKILLPPNVLYELNQKHNLENSEQLCFKISNPELDFGQVCCVHEFSAPPGVCHIPYHIMSNLAIKEGSYVNIEKITPVKGTYVKLRLHSAAFVELSDPKAILEKILSRDYPVLTQGHTIALHHTELNRTFYIDVIKTEPAEMINITNTDINVDFDAPLDYIPPQSPERPPNPTPLSEPNLQHDIQDNLQHNLPNFNFGENKIIGRQNDLCCQEKKSPIGIFVPFAGKGNRLGSQ